MEESEGMEEKDGGVKWERKKDGRNGSKKERELEKKRDGGNVEDTQTKKDNDVEI